MVADPKNGEECSRSEGSIKMTPTSVEWAFIWLLFVNLVIACGVYEVRKVIGNQQKQVDDLKRELEELKRKLNQ